MMQQYEMLEKDVLTFCAFLLSARWFWWYIRLKLETMTGTGRAMTRTPLREHTPPTTFPAMVFGTMSPYLLRRKWKLINISFMKLSRIMSLSTSTNMPHNSKPLFTNSLIKGGLSPKKTFSWNVKNLFRSYLLTSCPGQKHIPSLPQVRLLKGKKKEKVELSPKGRHAQELQPTFNNIIDYTLLFSWKLNVLGVSST